jgi:hypothetical protein
MRTIGRGLAAIGRGIVAFLNGIRKMFISAMGGIDTPKIGMEEIMELYKSLNGPEATAGDGAVEALNLVGADLRYRKEINEVIQDLRARIAEILEDNQLMQEDGATQIDQLKAMIAQLQSQMKLSETRAKRQTGSLKRKITGYRKVLRFFR